MYDALHYSSLLFFIESCLHWESWGCFICCFDTKISLIYFMKQGKGIGGNIKIMNNYCA